MTANASGETGHLDVNVEGHVGCGRLPVSPLLHLNQYAVGKLDYYVFPLHVGHTDWRVRNLKVIFHDFTIPCNARNGGWQAWGKTKKFHGIPPTSVTSLAFSGKFMKDSVLVVQTPCDWDYDEQKCLTTDTIPRITWNGEVMKDDFEIADPPVSVSNMKGKDIVVKLPDGVLVKVQQWGNWKPATAYMAFNVHIQMPRFSTGVCGHCGNYDPDSNTKYNMYNKTGFLANSAAGSLCKAEVHCKDRLITETFTKSANDHVKQCVENKPPDVTFDMSDCPEEQKEKARAVCDAEFGKQGKFANEEEKNASYQACLVDACLDPNFAAPDA
jgi:hypothetical protein